MAQLEEGYPLFDWTDSNGTAFPAETQKAYTAATSQGQCSDFSRLVWNDIVNTVENLLTAMGLSWDSKYTTRTGALIMVQYGALTAAKFNSVRHNIQAVAFTTWRWQFDYLKEGYTGRNDFRGVSAYGKNADLLYGWYIIELVRKLNVAIELMRGTYPTAELDFAYGAVSHSDAQLPVLSAVPLSAVAAAASKAVQSLSVAGIAPIMGAAAAKSDGEGRLLAIPIVGLPAKGTAESKANSYLGSIATRPMVAGISAGSKSAASVFPAVAVGFGYSDNRLSRAKAEFVASMRSISLKPDTTAGSKAETALQVPGVVPMPVARMAESHAIAEFTANPMKALAAVARAATEAVARFDALGRVVFGAAATAESHGMASAILREPVRLAAMKAGRTDGKTELIHLPPLPISAAQRVGTVSETEMVAGVPRALRVAGKAGSYGVGGLATLPGAVLGGAFSGESRAKAKSYAVAAMEFILPEKDWYDPVHTGSDLYIRQTYEDPLQEGTNLDISEVYFEPVQEGSNLYIISGVSLGGEFNG